MRHREALQPMFLRAEIGGHAALAAIAAAERHAEQVAGEVVGPLVIGADELLRRAAAGGADLHAAMGAAIDQHVDRAIGAADGDHLAVAELAALEIARIGDFGFEADIEPVGRAEDAVQFAREDVRVGVDPVRHARSVRRPAIRGWQLPAARLIVILRGQVCEGCADRAMPATRRTRRWFIGWDVRSRRITVVPEPVASNQARRCSASGLGI